MLGRNPNGTCTTNPTAAVREGNIRRFSLMAQARTTSPSNPISPWKIVMCQQPTGLGSTAGAMMAVGCRGRLPDRRSIRESNADQNLNQTEQATLSRRLQVRVLHGPPNLTKSRTFKLRFVLDL